MSKREDPYFIEVDDNACGTCGAGRTWTVIGPDGVAASQSWEDEEDATAYADALNHAFWRGRSLLLSPPSQRAGNRRTKSGD